MSLKEWFLKREFKRISAKERGDYPGWEQVQKIGIYFEVSPMSSEAWQSWQRLFEEAGKEVILLSYQSVKRKELAPDWQAPTYCKDERTWLGFPQAKAYKDFKAEALDVLIDLSEGDEICHEAVFRASLAKLKVAFSEHRKAWSDLQVNCKEGQNSRACQEEVLALLKFINA